MFSGHSEFKGEPIHILYILFTLPFRFLLLLKTSQALKPSSPKRGAGDPDKFAVL